MAIYLHGLRILTLMEVMDETGVNDYCYKHICGNGSPRFEDSRAYGLTTLILRIGYALLEVSRTQSTKAQVGKRARVICAFIAHTKTSFNC